MHDTGVPASPFGQASVAVNTNRTYKIRYCDTIPAETKWQLSFSYAIKDEVYAILQGSPEQLVAISGATTVTSIAAVKATTNNNAIFWDATKNELHVKLVAVNGAPLNASSNPLTLRTKSGNKVVAQTTGINSRPYNDIPNLVGNLVQAENFDNGGQNIAYYSNIRYNFVEDRIGSPGIKMTTHLLPSSDYLHTTEVRTGELVKLNNSFKTNLGTNAIVIDKISAGEFWNYTFNVSNDGTFDMEMQIAASGTGNKWQIFVDDIKVKDTSFASLGSANSIESVLFRNIKLTKGTRVVTIKALSGNMAFDNFKIQKRTNIITGLEQAYEAAKCTVYPNPSQDGNFQLSQSVAWKIYNVYGLELKSGMGNSINLSENPKGIYLIKMNDRIERVVMD